MANDDFVLVTGLAELVPGGTLRIMREFTALSQDAAAERSGIPEASRHD